jgi:hypothetical protein
MVMPVGLCLLAANIQPAVAQQRNNGEKGRAVRRAVHEEHDAATNAVFSSSMDEQGNVRVSATIQGLLFEKSVAPSGEATLRLTQGADVVSIAMNQGGYLVERGAKTARLDPRSSAQEDLDAVRGVLLGSPAVRAFRRLVASLENRDDGDEEGPLLLGTLVDGAVVQMLDGDVGATHRIGKRLTRRRRAALRPAKLRPDNLFTDCILNYEMSLMEAWDLFAICTDTSFNTRWYYWYASETTCEFEFLIRSQQYIYQFIACFAFPF